MPSPSPGVRSSRQSCRSCCEGLVGDANLSERGLWAAVPCSPLMIEMALSGKSLQLPDFTLPLQVQSPEPGELLGRVKMSIKANRGPGIHRARGSHCTDRGLTLPPSVICLSSACSAQHRNKRWGGLTHSCPDPQTNRES